MVTQLIESAQTRPIDADPARRREITRTVKIAVSRARSLPVAVTLALVAGAFIGGVILGELRQTHAVAPVVIPGLAATPPPSPSAPPAPAAVANTAETGFDLRVDPDGAKVVLDGRAIGVAPLRVRNLVPGDHVIELAAEGYFARRLVIALEAGEPRELSIALDRLEPEVPAPAPAPEPRERAAARGVLKIGSKPPCTVVVDGREVGTTPEILELGAGRHAVSLVNPTYAISDRIAVTIKPGETVRVIRDYSEQIESSD